MSALTLILKIPLELAQMQRPYHSGADQLFSKKKKGVHQVATSLNLRANL